VSALPPAAFAAALAGLDRMTVGRLASLLAGHDPVRAVAMITGDAPPNGMVAKLFDIEGLLGAWRAGIDRRPPQMVWDACVEHRIQVLVHGAEGYPAQLLADPMAPPVLFIRGSFAALGGRRVGVVGTRNATAAGRQTATAMGRDLAAAGVHIVSGLARGIDGCAHRGALSVDSGAAPVGVVASGLDIVYPREHRELWDAVAERGVLISEAPPGTAPEAHRFPLRNRIIAALSEVLVVVESRETGGSLLTVGEAKVRGVTVMAVPGSVHNRAARGTNDLVRDGAPVAVDATDVLVALGLDSRRAGGAVYDPRPRPRGPDRALLEVCSEPRTLEQCALLSGRSLVECAMSLARLEVHGWLHQVNGWFEAIGPSGPGSPH
jgi:DNA processing protein